MSLLHLDSSILGANSVSRALSAAVVARLKEADPALAIVYRDLAADPIPHLSGGYLAAAAGHGQPHSPSVQNDLSVGAAVMEEFLAADTVVIGVAFYNFTVSSQLKTWIDRILVAGKTFRYTEKGPEGLVGNKRLILAISRGGRYGQGTPTQAFEHAETYLRGAFGFLGIYAPEVIVAEGVAIGAEERQAAVQAALAQIAALPLAA